MTDQVNEAVAYRKKPVVIEAMQFDGTPASANGVCRWANAGDEPSVTYSTSANRPGEAFDMVIWTLEGDMTASPGDWIIKGVKGEFYPCKPDIFAATYEPATHPSRGVVDDGMVARAMDADAEEYGASIPASRVRRILEAAALQAAALPAVPAFDMLAHLQRQREWSGRTFGPGPRSAGVIDHIRKELREIEADPTDLSEWIDVVILALDGAWRAGGTPEQIIATLVAKQTKNEGRTWPDWRTASPDKAIEHDRTQDALPAVPEGIVMPNEPTEEMLRRFWHVCNGASEWLAAPMPLTKKQLARARKAYFAMLAATPAHDQPEGSDNG